MRAAHWLLALLFLAYVGSTQAASPGSETYKRGLLWRIERNGRISYLFGTMHTDDPRVLHLPPPVADAFKQAHTFVMEALPSADGLIESARAMALPQSQILEHVIGADLYRRARVALIAHGQPITDLQHEKPWAVMMVLSYPVYHGLPLDYALLMQATRAGKHVAGLETTQEQLAIFDSLSLADQTHLLALTLDQAPQWQTQLDLLTRAYLARDLGALQTAEQQGAPQNDRVYGAFMQQLTHVRNLRMADRMVPYLKQGSAFIAIGALHLGGNDGVLHLLAQRGWRIESVY